VSTRAWIGNSGFIRVVVGILSTATSSSSGAFLRPLEIFWKRKVAFRFTLSNVSLGSTS
jgi:hypothetical protein